MTVQATGTPLTQARGLRTHDPGAALALAQEAVAQLRQQAAPLELAAALTLCANLQHDLSDYEAAIACAQEALLVQQAVQDTAGTIDSHDVLGKSHEKLGQHAQALAHHQQALQLSQALGDPGRACRALVGLGILRYDQSDYTGAIALYRQALDLALSADDAYMQGRIQGCLGNAFERMGEYARSLEHHAQCLRQFDEATYPRERSFALNNTANVYIALDEHRQAITFHEQSLALKRRLGDRWGEGTSLQNLGYCLLCLGELDRAQQCLQDSLQIVQAIGDREGMCMAHECLGDIAARRGDLDAAAAWYQGGLQISTELGDRYLQVTLLLCLGRAYRQQGRLDEAASALQQALQQSGPIQTKRLAQKVHDELSAVCEQSGDVASALAHVREAYRLQREVFGEDLDARLQHLKLHFELERADKETDLQRQKNQELALANAQKEKLLKTLERQKRQLQRQSIVDALTGLHNRRHFDHELARAFKAARRYAQPLSVVLCDIDDFKRINDRFSHATGDQVLKAVGRLLQKHCRKSDIVARHGGEEFALLLTNTAGDRAQAVCEKLRQLVEAHDWSALHADLRVTLSLGIADEPDVPDAEALMKRADERLYRAKREGKNRVVAAG